MKRVFLIVLDSCGAGALPDAAAFGDAGAHTLKSCYATEKLYIPNLKKLGIGNVAGLEFLGGESRPQASYGRMAERSNGKDTTTGHWELAGLVSDKPMPTYPNGFPTEILDEFQKRTGRGVLCNKPYSGTEVIRDYGDEHVNTGDLIVYTSADSVFQIAAHEEVVSLETLYEYCRIARELLCGEHAVGRVIARPFVGKDGVYTRTANRRDFSLQPPRNTMLNALKAADKAVVAVGKITDIFAGCGITETIFTHGNDEGMQAIETVAQRTFHGLCFTNLVDFDMVYGHRNNAAGYTQALNTFDRWLGEFLPQLQNEDLLIITADHGCDPGDISTDHTREYVPLLVYGNGVIPRDLNTRTTFADVAATVCAYLDVKYETVGASVL
ncbi:MAG: phosphopentomutase [Clostridia bacterium]|nr:phosphopentomutase [Clostridia bacterium]